MRSIGRCAAGERTVDRADFRAASKRLSKKRTGWIELFVGEALAAAAEVSD